LRRLRKEGGGGALPHVEKSTRAYAPLFASTGRLLLQQLRVASRLLHETNNQSECTDDRQTDTIDRCYHDEERIANKRCLEQLHVHVVLIVVVDRKDHNDDISCSPGTLHSRSSTSSWQLSVSWATCLLSSSLLSSSKSPTR